MLENEMMELKESLSEWKSMPSVLHIEESASVAGPLPRFSVISRTDISQIADAMSARPSLTCACFMRTKCRICIPR